MRIDKGLKLLRANAPAVIKAASSSRELLPYMNLLRDVLDDRTKTVKIEEAVTAALVGMDRLAERYLVGAVRRKIKKDLPNLPLAEVPCEQTVRSVIQKVLATGRVD